MATLRLLVTRLRQDQLPLVLIMLLVFVSAVLAAAAPRLFNAAADAGIRYEVSSAGVLSRNLQLGRISFNEALDGGMASVRANAAEVHSGLPPTVAGLIDGSSAVAKSVTYSVLDRPIERPGFVTFAFQEDLGGHVELTAGRMPEGTAVRVPAPDLPPASVPIPEDLEALEFEVALSQVSADELGLGVGDRIEMIPDPADPLVGAFGFLAPAAARIVGIFEVVDPAADYWVGDRTLAEPQRVPVGINSVLIYATALGSPEAYPDVGSLGFPMRYTFRHTIDADRLDAGMLDELVTELQQMEAVYPSFATGPDPTRTTLQTGLLELTQRFRSELRSSEAVLSTAAIGPASVAIAAIGVLAALAIRRRRGSLILLRGRGGSAFQIVGSHIVEGLLLSVAPAAGGALAAASIVDPRPTPLSWSLAGMVAIAAILVIGAVSVPAALTSVRKMERDAPAAIGASPRRLAFEGLAVGLAIGGVILLRQRGLAGGSAVADLAGVDPFLAAVPVLVGVAVGIVTLRVYPYPVRAAGWMAAAGRGVVPALGLRRAERQTSAGQLPLLVLLLTVAIGTFSSTMLATIDRGQMLESWQSIGAAHRVTSGENLDRLDLGAVPGVEATAAAHVAEATFGIAGTGQTALIAVDVAAYLDVTRGTPAEVSLPAEFVDLPIVEGAELGTDENPLPAIISRELARTSTAALGAGDTFVLTIRGRFTTLRVVEVRTDLPAATAGRGDMLVPLAGLSAAIPDRPFPPTAVYVRAPADARDAVVAAARNVLGGAVVLSQAQELASLRERPLVDAVRVGFSVALGAAIAYAAFAVIVSLLLAGLARAKETAHLRSLGIGRGQVTMLAVVEHGPPVLVAVAAGLVLGVAVAWVVLPGFGLAAFTGASVDPVLTVDLGQLVVLSGVLMIIVAVGVGLAAWAQRRADPAGAIRSGAD